MLLEAARDDHDGYRQRGWRPKNERRRARKETDFYLASVDWVRALVISTSRNRKTARIDVSDGGDGGVGGSDRQAAHASDGAAARDEQREMRTFARARVARLKKNRDVEEDLSDKKTLACARARCRRQPLRWRRCRRRHRLSAA